MNQWFNIFANSLSFSRIILLIPLIICELKHLYFISLFLIIIVILSDIFDGFLARLSEKQNSFGSIIDITADLIFIIGFFLFLIITGKAPVFLIIFLGLSIISYSICCISNKKLIYTYVGKFTGTACYIAISNLFIWRMLFEGLVYRVISDIIYFLLICYLLIVIFENIFFALKNILQNSTDDIN